jgi:hypothetical protein
MSLPRPVECPFCHSPRVMKNGENGSGFTKYGRTVKWKCGNCHVQWTTHEHKRFPRGYLLPRPKIIKDRVHIESFFEHGVSVISDSLGHTAKVHLKNGTFIVEKARA